MSMAQHIEDKNSALQTSYVSPGLTKGKNTPTRFSTFLAMGPNFLPKITSLLGLRSPATGSVGNPPFKRLSEAKWRAKHEKGFCFRCDEKYSIGHKCKNKELHVMMIYDEEVGEAGVEEALEA